MSNFDIYYSQVNKQLQLELNERAAAGVRRRTKDYSFIVENVANVELIAYDGDNYLDNQQVPLDRLGILGGNTVRTGDYLPAGFLKNSSDPKNVLRTKPFLTGVDVEITDQSRGYLNKGKIKIYVPDPGRDLDLIEDTFCKFGRCVKIRIVHPESAILTENKLSDSELVDYSDLVNLYPNTSESDFRKMNELNFNGKILTFSYSYDTDGSATVDIDIIGTTGTYIAVSTYISNNNDSVPTEEKDQESRVITDRNNFYYEIETDVQAKIKEVLGENTRPIEIKYDTTKEDLNILYAPMYKLDNNNNTDQDYQTFISLGLFIKYVNDFILDRIRSSNTIQDNQTNNIPRIICDDQFCKSIYYSELVSASPQQLLLWPGRGGGTFNVYGTDADNQQKRVFSSAEPVTAGIVDQVNNNKILRPSRIYINVELIKDLINTIDNDEQNLNNDVSVQKLLFELAKTIEINTGSAFRLRLTQHPEKDDILLYYDTNYYDPSIAVQEYFLPVFASNGGKTVCRDISITAKIPTALKEMIYGIQSGTSTKQVVSLSNAYIYSDTETRESLRADHRRKHEDALKSLEQKKLGFAKQPDGDTTYKSLKEALSQYIVYYDVELESSLNNTKPVFPLEISFTIDGINGFKYGDVLNIQGIPAKYSKNFVFMVIGISHKVTDAGDWSTTITLVSRVRVESEPEI